MGAKCARVPIAARGGVGSWPVRVEHAHRSGTSLARGGRRADAGPPIAAFPLGRRAGDRPRLTLSLPPQAEWRGIGVQQSRGWVHYAIHRPEPHVSEERGKGGR